MGHVPVNLSRMTGNAKRGSPHGPWMSRIPPDYLNSEKTVLNFPPIRHRGSPVPEVSMRLFDAVTRWTDAHHPVWLDALRVLLGIVLRVRSFLYMGTGFLVLSLVIMFMDHRQHHLETIRSGLSILIYPLQYVVNIPSRVTQFLLRQEDVGEAGYQIPYNVETVQFLEHDAKFIIAIETGGMYDRLIENGFDEKFDSILVHLKGQPARSTRRASANTPTSLPMNCCSSLSSPIWPGMP